MTFRDWLRTSMEVSYAQVLGAGVSLLALLWVAGTLALWLYEMGQQIRTLRAIEHHQLHTIDRIGDELHLCRRALGQQGPHPRAPQRFPSRRPRAPRPD